MVNLFAYRATDPRDMKYQLNPIGPDNNGWILDAERKSFGMVAAWGAHGAHMSRDREVLNLGLPLACLGVTKDGHPKHPLYLKATTKLIGYADKGARLI